ncbi:MAG TPA: YbhB/YbcL family Raf kinase inhibitor-like protein [Edaphobacter sp.]
MRLTSKSFKDDGPIPGEFAFAVVDSKAHVALSKNRNPDLAWSDVPTGTKSFALICCDPDVPSKGDDVNQEGRVVPASLPRVNFYHWLLWNIPASMHGIAAGSQSDGVTPRGKNGPEAPGGMRHGINYYTGWFAGDAEMEGDYYGYDGPCPPWNDSIVHRYYFTLYALDVERLDVRGEPTAERVQAALKGHVLAEARVMGTYSLNPRVK